MKPLSEIKLVPDRPALDERPLERRVGLIILATDHTTEPDFRRMVASERIGVYVARIPYANPTTPENLRKMQPALTAGAALILPDEPLDAICYSCTSASVVIGDAEIETAIQAAKSGIPVVTPPMAGVRGLNAFGVRRISILTPYTVETSRPMATYFAERGFEVLSFTCLGFEDDREMARIAPAALINLARRAMHPQADALFVSCTALRGALAVTGMEQAIGRPVVTSNQATAWNCLRLCGDETAHPEFGRLMTLPLPRG
ncbi:MULTISPECIES: ectoine utilization protein EutA [unclassified Mesorhizobium]|uniref:ectoine utilization protein EutA n=1 Tax=unclassified Mesorhizobium TaxID=325217 RepID=UPI00112B5750|nr:MULTISPECIES: ectoine utilization protein EutA [unclassified Mesorhizobium]MBZ9696922.1 ectoine utilization protein EutA [Mesorhizobium sp. CO1-1-9]MBZ9906531.1 ectoine utilization protein EutA [Mesorhizobium sp. BR115XR7A]MBZ9932271.1 ectoine utilization protein EutA [Mesorhizobium sp. BR1-1-5]TPK09088.1 ectoine utilization protein EutA [Mesorhizobium sp. B2-5-7]